MFISTEIDKTNIDHIIRQFFGIFNNKDQSEHDWNLIYRICIPETIIIKKQGLGQAVYNLQSFIEPRIEILTDGTISGFEEKETEEQTTITKNIALRHSKYQKSGYSKNQFFSESGTKLFTLVRTGLGWQICSLTWEDDAV